MLKANIKLLLKSLLHLPMVTVWSPGASRFAHFCPNNLRLIYFFRYYTQGILLNRMDILLEIPKAFISPDLTWCTPVCTCQWCFPPTGFSAGHKPHGGPAQLHVCRMDTWNGPLTSPSLLWWGGMDLKTGKRVCMGQQMNNHCITGDIVQILIS